MSKRPVKKYDFKPYGAAIKRARKENKESRKMTCDAMYISSRYLANIPKPAMRRGGFGDGLRRIFDGRSGG